MHCVKGMLVAGVGLRERNGGGEGEVEEWMKIRGSAGTIDPTSCAETARRSNLNAEPPICSFNFPVNHPHISHLIVGITKEAEQVLPKID
jgi:hypothetical protein